MKLFPYSTAAGFKLLIESFIKVLLCEKYEVRYLQWEILELLELITCSSEGHKLPDLTIYSFVLSDVTVIHGYKATDFFFHTGLLWKIPWILFVRTIYFHTLLLLILLHSCIFYTLLLFILKYSCIFQNYPLIQLRIIHFNCILIEKQVNWSLIDTFWYIPCVKYSPCSWRCSCIGCNLIVHVNMK